MVREWLESKFEEEEVNSLLKENVYSDKEIKKDKKRLNRRRRDLTDEIEETQEKYKELIEDAAGKPKTEAVPIIRRAKIERQKHKVKKRQLKKNSALTATLVSIQGARDIVKGPQRTKTKLETLLEDETIDTDDVQEEMITQMTEFGITMETMAEVQEALNLDIIEEQTIDTDIDDEVWEDWETVREQEVPAEEVADFDEAEDKETIIDPAHDEIGLS